jgi:hypothetical protein
MLPEPSAEQQAVIGAMHRGNNAIVDSVAGSGKTTTSLLLASQLPDKRIVLVTYNRRLKEETRERVDAQDITNLEVHSYHSMGLKYYKDPCFTDMDLRDILRQKLRPRKALLADIFIFDEAQDMTPIYFDFLKKVLADNGKEAQLLLLGDHLQCIYDFPQKGADVRYLTMADRIFPSTKAWEKLYLQISYRITKPIRDFVNDCMLGYPRLKAIKESKQPVRYITGDPFVSVPMWIFNEIMSLLSDYEPDDIFILAPSVKSNNDMNPINKLENLLVKNGVSCFCPTGDDEELKDEVLKGKIVFSSFHQSKGLERKVVFVCSFSTSYYFIGKDEPRDVCPKPVYVAATRAKERLYCWAEDGGDQKPFPFLRLKKGGDSVELVKCKAAKKRNSPPSTASDKYLLRRVTDLTKFIPEEVTQTLVDLLQVEIVKPARHDFQIPGVIDTPDGKKENVFDLNGTAIPTIYEHRLTGKISIQQDLEDHFLHKLQQGNSLSESRIEWVANIKSVPSNPSDYLMMANLYGAYTSNYLFKIAQIRDYGWLSKRMVESLLGVLTENVKKDSEYLEFERTLEFEGYEFGTKEIQLVGRADLIDDDTLWEIKCVDSLKPEHIIQLALYAWLWYQTEEEDLGRRAYKLINIRTGEIQQIRGIRNLGFVLDFVLDNHFREKVTVTDEAFVERAKAAALSEVVKPVVPKMFGGGGGGFMFVED